MSDTLRSEVRFFYLKSSAFRVMHVDGGIGSITPRGLIHLAIYSERPAIPQSNVQSISPEGELSKPHSPEGREGIVREIDADLMMSKETAVELRDWLSQKIAELEHLELNARQVN